MTRNAFQDGEGLPAAALNALKHAFEGEGTKSGGDISPGTGDFEVDVSTVEYHVSDTGYSATAATLTHDAPDAEDRLDLITADTTETLKIVKGDPASVTNQPDAHDIPTDEVLLGVVLIRSGAAEILDSDIFDEYKTIVHLLEDWTTDSTTAGEVPVSQGDGTVQMASGEGSGIDADTLRGSHPLGNDDLGTDSVGSEEIQENSVGSSETNQPTIAVEGFGTQGGSGTVPVSQGDGSVAMDSGANSGIDADTLRGKDDDKFVEFGDSTQNNSSGGSGTFSLPQATEGSTTNYYGILIDQITVEAPAAETESGEIRYSDGTTDTFSLGHHESQTFNPGPTHLVQIQVDSSAGPGVDVDVRTVQHIPHDHDL